MRARQARSQNLTARTQNLTATVARAPRGRPVRATTAGAIALAIAAMSVAYRDNWFNTAPRNPQQPGYLSTVHTVTIGGAIVFVVFGMLAVLGLARAARWSLEPVVGADYASVARYAIILIGTLVVAVGALSVADIQLWQLILPGAITGVLVTIAAQQALGNVFAGLMLQFARPFSVGERIEVRSGQLNGPLQGTVVELSIAYVQLLTEDGLLFIPNSQLLAAGVGVPTALPGPESATLAPPSDTPAFPGATSTPADARTAEPGIPGAGA